MKFLRVNDVFPLQVNQKITQIFQDLLFLLYALPIVFFCFYELGYVLDDYVFRVWACSLNLWRQWKQLVFRAGLVGVHSSLRFNLLRQLMRCALSSPCWISSSFLTHFLLSRFVEALWGLHDATFAGDFVREHNLLLLRLLLVAGGWALRHLLSYDLFAQIWTRLQTYIFLFYTASGRGSRRCCTRCRLMCTLLVMSLSFFNI